MNNSGACRENYPLPVYSVFVFWFNRTDKTHDRESPLLRFIPGVILIVLLDTIGAFASNRINFKYISESTLDSNRQSVLNRFKIN